MSAPRADWSARAGATVVRMAGAGGMRRLSILIYHRVLARPDPLFPDEIDALRFEQHLTQLRRGFTVLPLREAAHRLREGSLPARAACLTFDDGYADNAEIALPILLRHGMHATFFVATGFLNGGRMWNDTVIELLRRAPGPQLELDALGYGRFPLSCAEQRQAAILALLGKLKYLELGRRQREVARLCRHVGVALPDDLMMSDAQVRALHGAGMEIGAHTVRHPILARLDQAAARREMADGKRALETLIQAPVRLFAYPNGKPGQDYQGEHVAIARELGFEAAVSTSWGAASRASDPHQLPRFTPWDRDPLWFMLRMARNLYRPGERV